MRSNWTIGVGLIFSCMTLNVTNAFAERQMPSPEKFIHAWHKEPTVPPGWTKLDEKRASITNGKNTDVFMLVTDGKNDVLIWFEKKNKYWNMVILETVPSQAHLEYGVKTEDLRLYVEGKTLLYGVDGSEAISLFKWDPDQEIFVGYAP